MSDQFDCSIYLLHKRLHVDISLVDPEVQNLHRLPFLNNVNNVFFDQSEIPSSLYFEQLLLDYVDTAGEKIISKDDRAGDFSYDESLHNDKFRKVYFLSDPSYLLSFLKGSVRLCSVDPMRWVQVLAFSIMPNEKMSWFNQLQNLSKVFRCLRFLPLTCLAIEDKQASACSSHRALVVMLDSWLKNSLHKDDLKCLFLESAGSENQLLEFSPLLRKLLNENQVSLQYLCLSTETSNMNPLLDLGTFRRLGTLVAKMKPFSGDFLTSTFEDKIKASVQDLLTDGFGDWKSVLQ